VAVGKHDHRFGLGILLTREVSRDRTQANRYLTNSAILRTILWSLALCRWVSSNRLRTNPDRNHAGLADAGNVAARSPHRSHFINATKIRVPDCGRFYHALVLVALGVVALLTGFGYVGLAVVSITTICYARRLLLACPHDAVRARLTRPPVDSLDVL